MTDPDPHDIALRALRRASDATDAGEPVEAERWLKVARAAGLEASAAHPHGASGDPAERLKAHRAAQAAAVAAIQQRLDRLAVQPPATDEADQPGSGIHS